MEWPMSNRRTSSFKEHASTDMHVRAMHLFKKQQSTNVLEYVSIARALTQLSLSKKLSLNQVYQVSRHNYTWLDNMSG